VPRLPTRHSPTGRPSTRPAGTATAGSPAMLAAQVRRSVPARRDALSGVDMCRGGRDRAGGGLEQHGAGAQKFLEQDPCVGQDLLRRVQLFGCDGPAGGEPLRDLGLEHLRMLPLTGTPTPSRSSGKPPPTTSSKRSAVAGPPSPIRPIRRRTTSTSSWPRPTPSSRPHRRRPGRHLGALPDDGRGPATVRPAVPVRHAHQLLRMTELNAPRNGAYNERPTPPRPSSWWLALEEFRRGATGTGAGSNDGP